MTIMDYDDDNTVTAIIKLPFFIETKTHHL